MKVLPVLFLFAMGIIFGVIFGGAYFHFKSHIITLQDYGNFGSYIGGVLGVFISALGFIAVVVTLFLSYESNEKLSKQIMSSDILRNIDRLETEIDSYLKSVEIDVDKEKYPWMHNCTAYDLLTRPIYLKYAKEFIVNYNDITDGDYIEKHKDKLSYAFDMFDALAIASVRLIHLLGSTQVHKILSDSDTVEFYYQQKYGSAIEILKEAGYPVENKDYTK